MPPNMSRIHKINGINGQLIWTKSISNTVGFLITEIYEYLSRLYCFWRSRLFTRTMDPLILYGDDGSVIWDKTYNFSQC